MLRSKKLHLIAEHFQEQKNEFYVISKVSKGLFQKQKNDRVSL
jgi:hypothetical protein